MNQLEQTDSSPHVSTSRDAAPGSGIREIRETETHQLDPMTFLVAEALFASPSVSTTQSIFTPAEIPERDGSMLSPAVCLVLLAHGSKDPGWCAPFERLNHELVLEMGTDKIRLAYMEFVGPTLLEIANRCIDLHILRIRLLPLFLAAGAHLATDVPRLVREVQGKFPALEIEILPPIDEDPRMARLLKQIVSEVAADSQVAADGTATVFGRRSLSRAGA
ncbi:MAG: CbiX/SirB N-terminal domain-containing protein [Acidobacteriota bacterium]|nr:CbiX/SirB N-terminal domain-containing protein [Acidobacteriota bacterium]